MRNVSNLVSTLKRKFSSPHDAFVACSYRLIMTNCERMLNYVLTDRGFCFTSNLEGFKTIFNEAEIADDFKSYTREKIAKSFDPRDLDYGTFLNDAEDEVEWELEKGYLNNSARDPHPIRSNKLNKMAHYGRLNVSDLSNLCPSSGKSFLFFYHMPNEIVTPSHVPQYAPIETMRQMYTQATFYTANDNLRAYQPEKRGCYFQDERKLKFFKSYTKAQCEFECMANITLERCGCVRFSMPRNNTTPICDLDKVECYLQITRTWPFLMSSCDCLESCFYIKYEAKIAKVDTPFVDAIIKEDERFKII